MAGTHTTSEDTRMAPEPPRNTVALGTGFGIGLCWLLMSGTAIYSSARGYGHHRYDWGLAWGLIGVLIGIAGTAAMIGTWWHLTRVRNDH